MQVRSVPDIYTSLIWAAQLKRAALLEQWLVQHMEHYPGPRLENMVDSTIQRGVCSCGTAVELTIVTTVVMRSGKS